jgi:hypothetical protein
MPASESISQGEANVFNACHEWFLELNRSYMPFAVLKGEPSHDGPWCTNYKPVFVEGVAADAVSYHLGHDDLEIAKTLAKFYRHLDPVQLLLTSEGPSGQRDYCNPSILIGIVNPYLVVTRAPLPTEAGKHAELMNRTIKTIREELREIVNEAEKF